MNIFLSPKHYPFLKELSKKEKATIIKQVFAENKRLQIIFYIHLVCSLVISGVVFWIVRPYISQSLWPILGGVSFGIIWYVFIVYMNSTSVYEASKSIYSRDASKSETDLSQR